MKHALQKLSNNTGADINNTITCLQFLMHCAKMGWLTAPEFVDRHGYRFEKTFTADGLEPKVATDTHNTPTQCFRVNKQRTDDAIKWGRQWQTKKPDTKKQKVMDL